MAILAECPVYHRRQKVSNKLCNYCEFNMGKFKKSGKVRYWVLARKKTVGRSQSSWARSPT